MRFRISKSDSKIKILVSKPKFEIWPAFCLEARVLLEAKKNNPHSERHKPPIGTYDHFRYDNSGKCTVRQ